MQHTPIDKFLTYLQQKQKLIQTHLTKLFTPQTLNHPKYPLKSLKNTQTKYSKNIQYIHSGCLFETRNKIQTRFNQYKYNKQQLLILSDILVWFLPNMCSIYMAFINYLKKWKQQALTQYNTQQNTKRNQLCKILLSDNQINLDLSFVQGKQLVEQDIIKIPLLIISEYFQKWHELTTYYQDKEKQFKAIIQQDIQLQQKEEEMINNQQKGLNKQQQICNQQLDEIKPQQQQQNQQNCPKQQQHIKQQQNQPQKSNKNHIQRVKILLDLSRLQRIQIQNRVRQAQKYIQDMDSVQSLDPQVYKNRLILNQYKPTPNPRNKYLFCFGKRLMFLFKLKKRTKKADLHIKQRQQAIFQLIDKQKNYIDGLTQYIQLIKQPIQQLKILTQDQQRLLFCNIQQIKKFHQQLHRQLMKRYQQHFKYQTYGDIIKSMIPFFKLYIDYIYQAQNAQNLLIKLIKQKELIKNICDKYFHHKFKPAQDQLMQPTYKIARYEMMFDEILKKTNPTHKDFMLFTQAKQTFKHKLREVNDTVDKIVRRNKLNQLEQQFGTQQHPLMKQNSQYLNEFIALMINQQKFLNVILFAFTDVILIAQETTRRKLKYIKVDEKFYVRRQQDSKVYRNVIKIHSSQGYVTLSTGNDDKNLKKADEMFQVLKKIQKTTQSKQLIYVQVLGTQEIGSTSFAKYTEYIIEIKFMTLKKLLHLRFSQVANIVKVMQNYYKNPLGITQEETLKKTWFNNHKSKTIEDRKRTIQQILQKLFNHQFIKANPMFLLNYLNLPENFFEIAKKLFAQKSITSDSNIFRKRESKLQNVIIGSSNKIIQSNGLDNLRISQFVISTLGKSTQSGQLSKKQLKQAFTLLCATQIKLGRDIYHDLDIKIQTRKQKAQRVQIYIQTMPNNEIKMVRVTQFDTVQDVCNKLSKLLGLRSNKDFRLFHEIGKKQLRVLQHQQLILKLFSFPRTRKQSSTTNMSSIVNNVTNAMQSVASSLIKVISPQTHPTLVFKKYYFLPFQIESRESKKDLTRLRLLTYQVFAQVKQMKYQLNFDQYLLFMALLIYIQQDGDTNINNINSDIVHTIIPQTIFKLKNYTQEQWLKKVQPHLLKYQQQIKKVIEYNELQMKTNKIKTDIPLKMALHFGHRHLASQIVLNRIKSNPIYGSNLFYVQPYKKTYQQLKLTSTKIAYNMWLAVKVDSISLLTPSSKQSQFQLKYSDIQKVNVYSQAIVFKTDDILNKQYRLNTYQSFQISQLVKYYKTLNEIMKELVDDQKLSNQVKKYRSQIQRYRSTYQNPNDGDIQLGNQVDFGVK